MGGAHEGERAMVIHEIREPGPEPMATLRVRSAALHGAEVGAEDVPAAIDELPLVALLGCFAEGETVVSGAEELRRKESDRIDAVVEGLGALGAEIEGRPDGFAVTGTGGLRGGTLDSRGDHRMAMLGAVAGLASERASRSRASTRSRSATRASRPTCGLCSSRCVSRGCSGDPRPARARGPAAGGRRSLRSPRGARSGRRSPAGRSSR